eukprot:757078-Hanusia_phi.AAC.1
MGEVEEGWMRGGDSRSLLFLFLVLFVSVFGSAGVGAGDDIDGDGDSDSDVDHDNDDRDDDVASAAVHTFGLKFCDRPVRSNSFLLRCERRSKRKESRTMERKIRSTSNRLVGDGDDDGDDEDDKEEEDVCRI